MRLRKMLGGLGVAAAVAFGGVLLHAKYAHADNSCDQISFDIESSGGAAYFQPVPEFAGLYEWWAFIPYNGTEISLGYPWTDHQYCAFE